MNSLLHYHGLGGQVQTIYMDPPYAVKFGSNFQPFVRKRDVTHGADEDMVRETEMVQAYRDTWELGVHSFCRTCVSGGRGTGSIASSSSVSTWSIRWRWTPITGRGAPFRLGFAIPTTIGSASTSARLSFREPPRGTGSSARFGPSSTSVCGRISRARPACCSVPASTADRGQGRRRPRQRADGRQVPLGRMKARIGGSTIWRFATHRP